MRFLLLIALLAQGIPALHAQQTIKPKLRYEPPSFDSVLLVKSKYKDDPCSSNTIVDWPVRNISDETVLFPELIEVWNDCPINDRYALPTPLRPGEKRIVHFRLNWCPRSVHWHVRHGDIHVPATYKGEDTLIAIPVSIKFYEDSTFFKQGMRYRN